MIPYQLHCWYRVIHFPSTDRQLIMSCVKSFHPTSDCRHTLLRFILVGPVHSTRLLTLRSAAALWFRIGFRLITSYDKQPSRPACWRNLSITLQSRKIQLSFSSWLWSLLNMVSGVARPGSTKLVTSSLRLSGSLGLRTRNPSNYFFYFWI